MKILFWLLLSIVSLNAAELKTAVLIITSDDKPAFKELQKVWLAYMNKDPEHFEVFFLRGDPNLSTPYEIKKNELNVKTADSYIPGILNKTILGMAALESRLDEFDYVLRTNLSSFYPWDNLLKYLNKLPREKCYCGISMHYPMNLGSPPTLHNVPFISGAGIILSRDVVKLLLKEHQEFDMYKLIYPDDVFLGLFYYKKEIPFISAQRWDYPTHDGWKRLNHKIEDHAYHFRAKANYAIRSADAPYEDELLTLNALLKKYYPDSESLISDKKD